MFEIDYLQIRLNVWLWIQICQNLEHLHNYLLILKVYDFFIF
jgi:hypothetical protein